MTQNELIYKLSNRLAHCRSAEINVLCNDNQKEMMKKEWDEIEKIILMLIDKLWPN